MELSNTPFDDVYRTMLQDCSPLIIPLINESFKKHYKGNEEIRLYKNEFFINEPNGTQQERITDSNILLINAGDGLEERYHIECETNPDSSMVIRLFEYDSQIALADKTLEDNVLTVNFPHTAVLYLRSNKNTPDTLKIIIKTSGTDGEYEIPVIKAKSYDIETIFSKNLLFLIPFYIFSHESRFKSYESDSASLDSLKGEYANIRLRLDRLQESGAISEYTKCTIVNMSNKVLEHIARNYDSIKKKVRSVMGGQVLEYEAKTILNEGIHLGHEVGLSEGLSKGRETGFNEGLTKGREAGLNEGLTKGRKAGLNEGRLDMLFNLVEKHLLSTKDAADQMDMDETEFLEKMHTMIISE